MSTAVQAAPTQPRDRSRARTAVELAVCLVVLVVLFRAFLAGGYMIETGSMAPCLLGYHREAICPSCRCPFAVEGSRAAARAVCPNCGKSGIAIETLPRNDGDHLLVEREAFALRDPRRWEVVVFRNPNKPTQAYVKRMIALPGEQVEIVDGDIYIDGKIQTKSYSTQHGMRIPVYDHDYRPDADNPDWQSRWVATDGGWTADGAAFRCSPPKGLARIGEPVPMAWVEYRHWIRRGGTHRTSVPVARWPSGVPALERGPGPLTFEAALGQLVCRGALSRERRDELLPPVTDPAFRRAIEELYEASHIAPITDTYGYNNSPGGGGEQEIRDLMLELHLAVHDATGQFSVELSDGTETLQCLLDFAEGRARLMDTRTGKAVRSADLPRSISAGGVRIEMSLMDQQALVAIDGAQLFEPWSYPGGVERGPVPLHPARFGARGGEFEVGSLKLFRDVHYIAGDGMRDEGSPRRLKADEYFVLGDNCPVSRDSRSWPEETQLGRELFIGKPLIVHLPSRKSRFRVGSWQTEIRIPEFSRIRYIR